MALCHMCRGSGTLSESPCSANPLGLSCSLCTKLVDLDQKIAELLAQRLVLLSDINQHHDQLFNRLPTEVCTEIFQRALPGIDLVSQPHERDRWNRMSSVPLWLSQVCRRWRATCHSSPQLWTVLTLYLGSSTAASCADILELAWAHRAGPSLPLSIVLLEGLHQNRLTSERSRSIFGLIATHAPRIYYLQAAVSTSGLIELCRAYQNRSFLKILRVFCDTAGGDNYVDNSPKFCPRMLHISQIGWSVVPVDTSILTHIEVTGLPILDCVTLIANSPVMVSCTLNGPSDSTSRPPPPLPPVNSQPSTRSHLKHLCILRPKDHLFTPYIFDRFDFPSLDSLSLRPPQENQQALFVAIRNHLIRSGSSMRTLSFADVWLQTPEEYFSFSQLIGVMAHTLYELILSIAYRSTYKNLQRQHISSLFASVLPGLSNLRSLTVRSPRVEWLYMLQILLEASLSIVTNNAQDLSVTLWFAKSPLSRPIILDYNISATPTPRDIQNILAIMQNHRISLQVKHVSGGWLGDSGLVVDISDEVTAALKDARIVNYPF